MLEQTHIARHQGGRCEAEDLPERKIPWHDRQDWPDRLIPNIALSLVRFHSLIGEEPSGIVRVEPACPCAFDDLFSGCFDRLTHLSSSQPRKLVLVLLEHFGRARHHPGSFRKR